MVWHRCLQPGALSSPKLCRLTASVNTSSVGMGCVGHTSVHSDSGSCAWGSGVCARRVEQQQHSTDHSDSGSRAWGSGGCARCVEQQQHGHTSVHCDRGPRAWGPESVRVCVSQQQQHSTDSALSPRICSRAVQLSSRLPSAETKLPYCAYCPRTARCSTSAGRALPMP